MAKQTYLFRIENDAGQCMDFERWTFKRLDTCINKMIELYGGTWASLYARKLDGAAYVTAYKTDYEATEANRAWRVTVEEFRDMLKEAA
jgi:hypothetical protein